MKIFTANIICTVCCKQQRVAFWAVKRVLFVPCINAVQCIEEFVWKNIHDY